MDVDDLVEAVSTRLADELVQDAVATRVIEVHEVQREEGGGVGGEGEDLGEGQVDAETSKAEVVQAAEEAAVAESEGPGGGPAVEKREEETAVVESVEPKEEEEESVEVEVKPVEVEVKPVEALEAVDPVEPPTEEPTNTIVINETTGGEEDESLRRARELVAQVNSHLGTTPPVITAEELAAERAAHAEEVSALKARIAELEAAVAEAKQVEQAVELKPAEDPQAVWTVDADPAALEAAAELQAEWHVEDQSKALGLAESQAVWTVGDDEDDVEGSEEAAGEDEDLAELEQGMEIAIDNSDDTEEDDELEHMRKRNLKLKARISALEMLTGRVQKVSSNMFTLESRVEKLKHRNHTLLRSGREKQAMIVRLKQDLSDAEARCSKEKAAVRRLERDMAKAKEASDEAMRELKRSMERRIKNIKQEAEAKTQENEVLKEMLVSAAVKPPGAVTQSRRSTVVLNPRTKLQRARGQVPGRIKSAGVGPVRPRPVGGDRAAKQKQVESTPALPTLKRRDSKRASQDGSRRRSRGRRVSVT